MGVIAGGALVIGGLVIAAVHGLAYKIRASFLPNIFGTLFGIGCFGGAAALSFSVGGVRAGLASLLIAFVGIPTMIFAHPYPKPPEKPIRSKYNL